MGLIELQQLLHANLSEIWESANPLPSKPIYHYTTPAGLVGILKDGAFRATNIRYLNDPKELDHATDIINEVIAENRHAPIHSTQLALLDHVAIMPDLYDKIIDIFVVCFSAHSDSRLNWTGYSGSEGLAVGIDVDVLSKRWADVRGRNLYRVIYDVDGQRALIREVLDTAIEFVASNFKGVVERDVEHAIEVFASTVRATLAEIAFCFKTADSSHEEEWRAVYLSLPYEVGAHPILPAFPNGVDFSLVQFRPQRGTLVPYVEVDLSPPESPAKIPIVEFVYGWNLDEKLTARALATVALRYGYRNARIRRSTVQRRA